MEFDEETTHRSGFNVRDALVFLVDWRVPMLKKDPAINISEDLCPTIGTSSLLSITMRCVADIMKAKIVSRSLDAVSVVAFGVRGEASREGWPGVRVIRPLRQCDSSGIKLLQHIAQCLEGGEADALLHMDVDSVNHMPVNDDDPELCFGSDSAVEFDKALWACRHQFTAFSASKTSVVHKKRIFVFTNDPDPSRGSETVKTLSIRQAKDLADLGGTLDVSVLTSPNMLVNTMQTEELPETSKFFNDLVYTDEDISNDSIGSVTLATVYSFEELQTRVRRKEMTKRALRRTVLVLGDDYKIGVALYVFVRKASRPTKVELVAATNKPACKITTRTCEEVGEILKPSGIRNMFQPHYLQESLRSRVGDQDAQGQSRLLYGFTAAETVKAKALGKVGLHMYGFRDKGVLRKELMISAPTFVYPDDSQYRGSTKAFVCLMKCMQQHGVIGIVSVRLSETSGKGIRFAALVPQQEEFRDDVQVVPGGFQLFYLPYKDDVYTAWRKELAPVSADGKGISVIKEEDQLPTRTINQPASVGAARSMMKRLKIRKFSPHNFLDPDLQRFYAGLEHAAGVETSFNPQDDSLNPDVEAMRGRAEDVITEMKRLEVGAHFDGEEEAERYGTKSKKRAAEQSAAALRKAEKEEAEKQYAMSNCDVNMYISRYRQGTLDKLLKPELQLYCSAHGIRNKGTKKNLVILVEDHISSLIQQAPRP